MNEDVKAAMERLKAEPELHQYLAMSRHFGCTVEEAKFRYANEKAFKDTVLLLVAESELEYEKAREAQRSSRHLRYPASFDGVDVKTGEAVRVTRRQGGTLGAVVADAAAQSFRYPRGV